MSNDAPIHDNFIHSILSNKKVAVDDFKLAGQPSTSKTKDIHQHIKPDRVSGCVECPPACPTESCQNDSFGLAFRRG